MKMKEDTELPAAMFSYLEYYDRQAETLSCSAKSKETSDGNSITEDDRKHCQLLPLYCALLRAGSLAERRSFILKEKRLLKEYRASFEPYDPVIGPYDSKLDSDTKEDLDNKATEFVGDFWTATFKRFDQILEKCSEEERSMKLPAMLVEVLGNIQSLTTEFFLEKNASLLPPYSPDDSTDGSSRKDGKSKSDRDGKKGGRLAFLTHRSVSRW